MRWHYRDPGLLWLFVPAYLLHVGEEWAGGFPEWIGTVVGGPLSVQAFIVINVVALALAVAGLRAATRSERFGWVGVAVATIALVNTLAHAGGAALTGSYSPGLFSAVVLYVPLGSLVILRAIDHAPRAHLRLGIAAGLVIHATVFVIAGTVARLG